MLGELKKIFDQTGLDPRSPPVASNGGVVGPTGLADGRRFNDPAVGDVAPPQHEIEAQRLEKLSLSKWANR